MSGFIREIGGWTHSYRYAWFPERGLTCRRPAPGRIRGEAPLLPGESPSQAKTTPTPTPTR